MRNKTIRRQIYFRLEEKLAQKLDKRIARAGYQSRSDFFTAVAYVALYGVESLKRAKNVGEDEHIAKLPETVTDWVRETLPRVSEEDILSGLHAIISEMLYPVIAMKGVDVAYENTWEDVRSIYHEKSGVWVTESDIREAFTSFAAVHKGELLHYREQQLRTHEQETQS